MSKFCDICGKKSGFMPYCKECRKKGKLAKCNKCGKWHLVSNGCTCTKVNKVTDKCVICGNISDGYLFCKDCYFANNKHIVLLSIRNGKDIQVDDISDKERPCYMCNDGHIVRSKSEALIDDYLFKEKIFHVYEKQLAVSDKKILRPDFYLPGLDIYIEHWGYENKKEYQSIKDYKINEYKKMELTVVTTCEEDIKSNIEATIERKIKFVKRGTIN